MELCGENGPGLVDHALIGRIIQIYKVLLPFRRKRRRINSVAVILTRDKAFPSGQVQGRYVMRTVS